MIPNMTITPINHPGITCHDDFTPAVPAAPINIPHTINIGYLTFLIFSFKMCIRDSRLSGTVQFSSLFFAG